jgi:hypothetical protein
VVYSRQQPTKKSSSLRHSPGIFPRVEVLLFFSVKWGNWKAFNRIFFPFFFLSYKGTCAKKSSETGILQIHNYFSSMITHGEGQCGKTEFFLKQSMWYSLLQIQTHIRYSSVKRKIRWMILRFLKSPHALCC